MNYSFTLKEIINYMVIIISGIINSKPFNLSLKFLMYVFTKIWNDV